MFVPHPRSAPDRSAPAGTGASGEVPDDGVVLAPARTERGTLVLRVFGELDLLSTPRCRGTASGLVEEANAFARSVGSDGRGRVVVDLSGVVFAGASALAMLVELQDRAARAEVDLVVVVAGGMIRRMVTLTGLDRLLTVRDELLSAVEATAHDG